MMFRKLIESFREVRRLRCIHDTFAAITLPVPDCKLWCKREYVWHPEERRCVEQMAIAEGIDLDWACQAYVTKRKKELVMRERIL